MVVLFEHFLDTVVQLLKLMLETVSVICVVFGFGQTMQLAWFLSRRSSSQFFEKVRLRFGMWLALALEFQLGADILATTISPTLDGLLRLAMIAVIRTFLNFFLDRELQRELKLERDILDTDRRS